mgnify:CR=1 FL=1
MCPSVLYVNNYIMPRCMCVWSIYDNQVVLMMKTVFMLIVLLSIHQWNKRNVRWPVLFLYFISHLNVLSVGDYLDACFECVHVLTFGSGVHPLVSRNSTYMLQFDVCLFNRQNWSAPDSNTQWHVTITNTLILFLLFENMLVYNVAKQRSIQAHASYKKMKISCSFTFT